MKTLLEHINEEGIADIRNYINESVKFYTPKEAVKILQQNLEEIPDEDDKYLAVYNSLQFSSDDYGTDDNKLMVKSWDDDNERYVSSRGEDERRLRKLNDFREKLFKEHINGESIKSMYDKGHELSRKAYEIEKLRQEKVYKETINKYPCIYELVRFCKLDKFDLTHSLWDFKNRIEDIDDFLESLYEKYSSKGIRIKDCKPGKKYFLISGEDGGTWLYDSKTNKRTSWTRARIGSIFECSGEGTFTLLLGYNSSNFSRSSFGTSTINKKLDENCTFILLDDISEYIDKKCKELGDKVADKILKYADENPNCKIPQEIMDVINRSSSNI